MVPFGFAGHYNDFLPSLNMRLDLTDKLVARFSSSRVMTRPTLTDLSPAQSILTNPGNEQITRGNPNLNPFRASQVETGLEWYFDKTSLLSLALFYKSIDSFVAQTTTPQQVDQVTFQVTEPTNGKGAAVKGLELNYRQAFTRLPGIFSGLGFRAASRWSTAMPSTRTRSAARAMVWRVCPNIPTALSAITRNTVFRHVWPIRGAANIWKRPMGAMVCRSITRPMASWTPASPTR
jgi:TonB-dependent receptor